MRNHLTMNDDDGMAYDSLRALSYGVLGRDRRFENLQVSASRLYGHAVSTLAPKLASNSKQQLARLIKPIAIMGSYAVS